MSHPAQREFVELIARHMPRYFLHSSVLEVGSLDISGSVRDFFTDCQYLGIDVAEGKGVDLVCQAQDYAAPDNSFDHVISCEAMEHNPHWVATFKNMVRLTKPGGLVVMTCATTGRPEHGTTRTKPEWSPLTVDLGWNYYRNLTEADFRAAFEIDVLFSHCYFGTHWGAFDLYFFGIKRGGDPIDTQRWRESEGAINEYITSQNRLKRCRYRAVTGRWLGDRWFRLMRTVGQATGSELLLYLH